jgi:hypothetical protein
MRLDACFQSDSVLSSQFGGFRPPAGIEDFLLCNLKEATSSLES